MAKLTAAKTMTVPELLQEWHASLARLRAFSRPIPRARRTAYEAERNHWRLVGNALDARGLTHPEECAP